MLKNKLVVLGILFGAAIITSSIHDYVRPTSAAIGDVRYMEAQYAADFSDDRVLVGASHNVFVGKVVRQISAKERGIGPETQFEVEVIDNIKGGLKGTVVVNQEGGYKNGKLYVVSEGDVVLPPKEKGEEYLLQPGSTYLLATRYNQKENWHTLNSYPTASKLLSKEPVSIEQLKVLVVADSRANEFKAAYPNEILLEADIGNNNALNSYNSLQKTQ